MSHRLHKVTLFVVIVAILTALSGCGGGSSTSMPATTIRPPDTMNEALTLSSGHGLAVGQFTVQPGVSETYGNVLVSCPTGGSACVVNVAADGSATYAQTGGTPTVMAAYEMWTLPANHGLAVGQFTVQPGVSETYGNVLVSCPTGGSACVVNVAADGSATYAQTGGTPTVMAAYEMWTLPANHGLAVGQFTVQPGVSETYGNVLVSCLTGSNACVVNVAADGSATYAQTGGTPMVFLLRPDELPELPQQRPAHAAQAPIVDLDDALHVGANVMPLADHLTSIETHNGVAISSGRVQDGVRADRVLEFLETHVAGGPSMAGEEFTFERGITGLSTFLGRPIVRLAEGTRDEFAEYAVRAVQLINTALPYEERIIFSSDPAPPLAAIEDVPDGEIFIDFAPTRDDWNLVNRDHPFYASAAAQPGEHLEYNPDTQLWESKGMRAGHVWISVEYLLNQAWVLNPDTGEFELELLETPVVETDTVLKVHTEEDILSTMVHELLHVLGFLGHNDQTRFSDSIMRGLTLLYIDHLPVIDGEALIAAYSRFEPGTSSDELSVENLGSWDDTSFHLRGDAAFSSGNAAFGVASRNGLAQPWAFGPTPWTDLADNPILSETVMWSGRLLGFTPAVEAVGGAADLAVELETLDGQLDFTELEHWATNADLGPVGSGSIWGDGDLQYLLNVHGNTFVQSGGDEGTVTGAFFGPVHEAMGGVLERTDLTAAFGGTR